MLFYDEPINMQDLIPKLNAVKELGKIKVAVVCFLFDNQNNLILQRRGAGARDDVGLLAAIGGSVNGSDIDFRTSLKRELKEEAGLTDNVLITDFIAAQIDSKTDRHTGELVNWIILGYKGELLNGELSNNEPDRCVGFEKNKMDKFVKRDLSKTCANFIQYMIDSE